MRRTTPAESGRVVLTGGFWADRVRLNREITIPHAYRQLQARGSIAAFGLDPDARDAAGESVYKRRDSDVAKWIEAASHSLACHPDPELERTLEEIVELVVGAQQPDGYLNTWFTVCEPQQRWKNVRDRQELYDAGHLMEAAVAHYRATGRRTLLDAMCRYAAYIASVFGPGEGQLPGYPGHEEIELALVRLARATGERRYVQLASFFIDERGRSPHFFDLEAQARGEEPGDHARMHPHRCAGARYSYYQAHLPVREQHTAEGHAVRAGYLYAGMVDVAVETGDADLLEACRRIWRNITERRMYVHGGIGSDPVGERFSVDYDLPNLAGFSETCAGIALVFFAHRMLQVDPDRGYADVIERTLFNTILACASIDGTRFFYANRLASVPERLRFQADGKHHHPPGRQPWYGTACCPTNLSRFLPALGDYVYSQAPGELWVHQFINSRVGVPAGENTVSLEQHSGYPWQGTISFDLRAVEPTDLTLRLRIPGWCRHARVQVGDEEATAAVPDADGYVKLACRWKGTERVVLDLEMPVERVEAHPAVWHDCGRVALQRGPIVFCLEEADNGPDLHDLVLPADASLDVSSGVHGLGPYVPVITTTGVRRDPGAFDGRLYRSNRALTVPCAVRAVPYALWANRGEGEMLVWMRE